MTLESKMHSQGCSSKIYPNLEEIKQNRDFFHNKILEILKKDSQVSSDLEKKLKSGNIIKFGDLNASEKAFIVANKTLQSYISAFGIWSILFEISGSVISSVQISTGSALASQFVWGLTIQAVVSGISGEMNVIDKVISRFVPSYIENESLKKKLTKIGSPQKLANFIKRTSEFETSELIKKLGDSAYQFTMLGMEGESFKAKIKRATRNTLNQMEKKAVFSFNEKFNEMQFEGKDKYEAFFKAFFLKIFYTTIGFLINPFSPNSAEDFSAGVIGNFTKLSSVSQSAIIALSPSVFSTIAETNKMQQGLQRADILAVRLPDNINSTNIKQSVKEVISQSASNLTSSNFIKNIVISGFGRAMGRTAFEWLLKPAMWTEGKQATDLEKILNSLYEGLRSGFAQQGGRHLTHSLIDKLGSVLSKTNLHKNFNNDINLNGLKNANLALINYIEEQENNLENIVVFLHQELSFLPEKSKDLRNLHQNWLLSFYSIKQDLEQVKNLINRATLSEENINNPKALSLSLLGGYCEISNIVENLSKTSIICGEYFAENLIPAFRQACNKLDEKNLIELIEKEEVINLNSPQEEKDKPKKSQKLKRQRPKMENIRKTKMIKRKSKTGFRGISS
jgi:hypothetical protein